MTTRGGFTLNGIHFNQTDSTRAGRPQTFLFLDGKRVSREAYSEALEAAKAAEEAQRQADKPLASVAELAAYIAPTAAPRQGLRAAAEAAVIAWQAGTEGALRDAMAALEAALTKPAPAARGPSEPRGDSKQATVITMLQREEGASNLAIAEATGWQPHTVRGFLAGLKKKGHQVEVLERVRMVGPNRGGAKGSYTTYRIPASA